MVFPASPSILNTAAAARHHRIHRHGCDDDDHRRLSLTSPRLQPPYVFSATTGRDWQWCCDAGTRGCLGSFPPLPFQQSDRKTSCRFFASKSPSNNHYTTDHPPVSDILGQYMQRREKLQAYQVAATWNELGKAVQKSRNNKWEQQKFWINHKASLQMLVDQTIQSTGEFNGRSTAKVTHSLVKILHHTGAKSLSIGDLRSLWNALNLRKTILLTQPSPSGGGLTAFEISNLIWAYAKSAADGIVHVGGTELNALAERAELCVDDFAPQGLANVAWGFATLNHKTPSLFDAIAHAAQACIDEFAPQALANTAWAFATLNHKAPLLFDAIARTAPVCMGDFKPQELSNTAWAFGTLNHEAPSLFDAIAVAAQARINEFNPQNLSNTAWSFARLKHDAPALFDAIARTAPVRINKFNPQGLANTAWAFAALNHEAPLLFNAIADAAQARIDEFAPQALANTAWSFATLKYEAPVLLDAIARAAPVRIGDFTPQNLANTAWAFATINQEAESLFDAIARAAPVRIGDFTPQELSNTAWAFATLNHEAPSLFEAIAQASHVKINEFNPHAIANTAWSFAVFNIEPDSFISADAPFAQKLRSTTDPAAMFSVEGLRQLHQIQLWCKEKNGATRSWYPDDLSQRCREAFVSTEASPSRLQNDVVKALGKLQDVNCVEFEVSTNSGYSLDAGIIFHGERIGVEVDGPSHFVGQSQSPNGKTVLKHRQLRALEGLKLVTIPYWEWKGIGKGSSKEKREKKQRYLEKLLDEAIVVSK
jgi:RAP domain